MQSNIWTLLTFIILPNGELEGNHLTYLFDSKTKCTEYLQSKYESSANNGKTVELKFNSSDSKYLVTVENNKIKYSTCRMSINWK